MDTPNKALVVKGWGNRYPSTLPRDCKSRGNPKTFFPRETSSQQSRLCVTSPAGVTVCVSWTWYVLCIALLDICFRRSNRLVRSHGVLSSTPKRD